MWLGICAAALLAWVWRAARRRTRLGGDEIERLRRIADIIHREEAQPFD